MRGWGALVVAALIAAVLAICAVGLAMIYSTTGGASRIYWTQVYALGLGLVAMGLALSIDYRSLADKSHWLYLAMMILLVSVLFIGSVRGGSRRWIDLQFASNWKITRRRRPRRNDNSIRNDTNVIRKYS